MERAKLGRDLKYSVKSYFQNKLPLAIESIFWRLVGQMADAWAIGSGYIWFRRLASLLKLGSSQYSTIFF
jgi:hypothetical protein